MAAIDQRPSGKWRVRDRDYDTRKPDGSPTMRSWLFDTKAEAVAHKADLELRRQQGQPVPTSTPTDRSMTYGQLAERWLEHAGRDWTEKTARDHRDRLRNHLRPVVGDVSISALTAPRIRQIRTDLEAKGTKPGVVKHCLAQVQRVLGYAQGLGFVEHNAADFLSNRGEKPTTESARRRGLAFTPTQIEQMRTKAKAQRTPHALRNATLISVLAIGGLRRAEALALKWSDYRDGRLHIERANTADGVGPTKTWDSARFVKVWKPLADDLAEWREASAYSDDDDLIFPNADGELFSTIDKQNWSNRVWKPCRPDGVEPTTRPYDARHTHASWLVQAQWSEVNISRRLGHSPATLRDVYSHVLGAYGEDEKIDPTAEVLKARGVEAPDAAPATPDDTPDVDPVAARLASLSQEQREKVLDLIDNAQWDDAVAGQADRIPR